MSITSWDKELNDEESVAVLARIALAHCVQAGPKAHAISVALADSNWSELVHWNIDYACLTALEAYHIRQALALFQKLEFLDIGIDKEAAARLKFYETEVACRETNRVFSLWAASSGQNVCFSKNVERVLYTAQRKIAKVLGPVPSISSLELTFGPGATTTVKKRNACARIKLSTAPSCSTNAIGILPTFFREVPHWSALHAVGYSMDDEDYLVETVAVGLTNGKLSFVPKNAKTFRSVMTEPTINAMLQGGYGKHIARRLLRVGQDIHDQSRNQRLAREGSLTGALATLDLSSASDSISSELVAHLLPYDWYSALSTCRTPVCEDKDSTFVLEKFSSMGNGFTFPLQTLIFWALATSCQECYGDAEQVSVYGDDIIAPTQSVPLIMETFLVCGFQLNSSKSYWDGPFRESCGKDYFLGVDIRPYYQKRKVSGETLFVLHNYYVRTYQPEMAAMVLEYIPEHVAIFGPDGFGDGHLLGDWKPIPHKRDRGWGGFLFDTYKKLGLRHNRLLPGDRVLPHYSIYVSGNSDAVFFNMKSWPYWKEPCRIDFAALGIPEYNGVKAESLPGTRGYKRISIYTLTPA